MDIYVARQPIFNVKKSVYAYELLFREGLQNAMPDVDGDVATSKVLMNSYVTIGIDKITGGKRAFINFTKNLLLRETPMLFPPERTVVEVLENIDAEEEIIKACKKMSNAGYLIALDDFDFRPELEPLISCADIIKIDFRLTPIEEINTYVDKFANNRIKFLAEKVETYDEFQKAKDMGFEYFQGYFFCKPEVVQGKEIPSSDLTHIRLMAEVNTNDFDFEKLEGLIQKDVSISYKLLRYINSAFFKRRNDISSIKQALVLLGEREIRRFVSLMAMTKLLSDKPSELINTSCVRAKFCELLGTAGNRNVDLGELFTLGLFSNIDAILDRRMKDIMDELPLSNDIIEALMGKGGVLMDFLELVKNYESGGWEKIKELSLKLDIPEEDLPPLYLQSCEWSNVFSSAK